MPIRAKSPCRLPGCRALVDKPGYCPAHAKKSRAFLYKQQKSAMTEDAKELKRFYDRVAWKKVRALQLQLEPLCRECRKIGKLTAATVVDHIIERSKGGADYDHNNLRSVCAPCHNEITRRSKNVDLGGGSKV